MKKIDRRQFVKDSVKITSALAAGMSVLSNSEISEAREAGFVFSQIPLPYAYKDLEPHIDAMTMEIHYSKHHAAYVKNVNDAIAAEQIAYTTEGEFFSNASKLSAKARNNSGGVWNHNFFWQVMKPGSGTLNGKVTDALVAAFGSPEKFKVQFTAAATGQFGSGWAWLVKDGGKLRIGSTPNQDNPMMDSSPFKGTPLLAIDVWEHAYYLKYQNKRAEYVSNWWNVVNWEEVAKRLA